MARDGASSRSGTCATVMPRQRQERRGDDDLRVHAATAFDRKGLPVPPETHKAPYLCRDGSDQLHAVLRRTRARGSWPRGMPHTDQYSPPQSLPLHQEWTEAADLNPAAGHRPVQNPVLNNAPVHTSTARLTARFKTRF